MTQHNNQLFSLYIDGGARGNPGPAAVAWVLKDPDGNTVVQGGRFLGDATNNVAEYESLIGGIAEALNRNIRALSIFSDSDLLVKQIKGEYKVKNVNLRLLWEKVGVLTSKLDTIAIEHIPRELNREADKIVNQILDKNQAQRHIGT